jgi:NADH-quinone oxidoreductase subunit I
MYGTGLAKGLMVTLRHVFKPPTTVQFPEEVRDFPARARTSLLWFDERCTGCSTCAQACPDGCILVATEPREDGSLNKVRYEIDFRICMYCGLCTEACPYEAIQPGGTFRDAVYWFDDMYHDKYELTRLAHEHLQKNEFTYPNGLKAPRSVIDFIEAEARGENVAPPGGTHAQIPSQPNGALLPGASGQTRQETIDRG